MDRVGTDGLLFRTTIRGGVAGYEVFSYIGTSTDIVIPNYIFDQPVVSIAQDALPSKITSLSISSNTEWLPEFDGYTNLVSFDFNGAPVNTTAIGMFDGCSSLEKVDNYENIEIISYATFRGTKIIDFDFTNITSIGSYAFGDCNIIGFNVTQLLPKRFVYIPETVLAIGTYAFDDEIAVYYAGSACDYSGELLYKNVKHNNDGYYYIDNGASVSIVNYDGETKRITLPSVIDEKPVVALSDFAFYINPYVERVEIPSSVKTIGEATFYMCKNLYGVFIPDSIESCGEFEGLCSNQSDGFENTTVFFADTTFDYAGGVTSPEQLGLVKYVTGVKPNDIIDDSTCIYVRKTLSYEVVTIKNITGLITIPAKINQLPVTRINTYAIYGDTLTTAVIISDGIDKISTQAFCSNRNLQAISVPLSIDAVNYRGFYNLSKCTVYVEASSVPADWDSTWYYSINSYVLGSKAMIDSTSSYLYEIVDGKVYLKKYLKSISTTTPIFVPDKIDGKTVYGIRSYCYQSLESNSSSNRYVFIVPSTITVIESYAINLYGYGYCDLYLNFDDSSSVPSTWGSSWCYSTYGYTKYATKYYSGQWKMVNGVPVVK